MKRLEEFLRVLLPGLALKRWLVVVFVGLLQMALGAAIWLNRFLRDARERSFGGVLTLRFLPQVYRGFTLLVSGGLLTFFGWRHLSRSIMRIMLPERPETDLARVIIQRQRAERGRRVVVIGGDPGVTPIIEALQLIREEIRVDVILPATDTGHLAQDLRDKLGLSGQQIIFPTVDNALLYATLDDGRLLEGAPTINRFSGNRITELFLSRDIRRVQVWEPESVPGNGSAERLRNYMPNVSEGALEALSRAELIIFAPGRIYTQLLPNLTMPRFAQAIQESSATKLFVANVMTEPGRTDHSTVGDYLKTIREMGGVTFDYVIVHQSGVSEAMLAQYHNEGAALVHADPEEEMSRLIFADTGEQTTLVEGAVILAGDVITEKPQIVSFVREGDVILREMPVVRHDPQKVASFIQQLLLEER